MFDRICDKTTYTEAEARDLVITLLKVLAYLHSKNIAHRDLKPENLLLRGKKNDTDIVLAGRRSTITRQTCSSCYGTPPHSWDTPVQTCLMATLLRPDCAHCLSLVCFHSLMLSCAFAPPY